MLAISFLKGLHPSLWTKITSQKNPPKKLEEIIEDARAPNRSYYQDQQWIVFAGPVCWTKKMTKSELNPTAKYWTTGCGCPNFEIFRLPVVTFVENSKD